MSCNYADGLSPYHDKGQLGLEEKFDSKSVVSAKVSLLSKWVNEAKHVVIHTGAGISTSAGIPDFRGPRGVWTLQAKGEKPDLSKDFNDATPTITHMAIAKLVEREKVKYVVSQNIDGLHLRSNLPRKYLSELHGNMFTEQCNSCNRQFIRSTPVPTVGQKLLNKPCPATKANGRPCRGRLHDTILDWEHNLPENDLGMADYHSCLADLSISLGTTMQIVPSGNLPLYTKRHGGKLVIVNLQPTKHNKKADLLINAYVDEVMTMLMKNLNLKIPKYTFKNDPTRVLVSSTEKFLEWTISDSALKKMKKIYEEKCGSKEARKRLEMIYDDIPSNTPKNVKRKAKEEEDSDLEVLDVIVKPKKSRESSKRTSKKNATPVYSTTITIKKVTPPPKKGKYEAEKITIKKNVTPTKTKYEIVNKPKKIPKCEIVYSTDSDLCNDLDMICESDDDETTNNFTYNYRMYLHDKKDIKPENTVNASSDTQGHKDLKGEEIKKENIAPEKNTERDEKNKETDSDSTVVDGTQEVKKEELVIIIDKEEPTDESKKEKYVEENNDSVKSHNLCNQNSREQKENFTLKEKDNFLGVENKEGKPEIENKEESTGGINSNIEGNDEIEDIEKDKGGIKNKVEECFQIACTNTSDSSTVHNDKKDDAKEESELVNVKDVTVRCAENYHILEDTSSKVENSVDKLKTCSKDRPVELCPNADTQTDPIKLNSDLDKQNKPVQSITNINSLTDPVQSVANVNSQTDTSKSIPNLESQTDLLKSNPNVDSLTETIQSNPNSDSSTDPIAPNPNTDNQTNATEKNEQSSKLVDSSTIDFYNNEFSSSNSTPCIDYVERNYYNNF